MPHLLTIVVADIPACTPMRKFTAENRLAIAVSQRFCVLCQLACMSLSQVSICCVLQVMPYSTGCTTPLSNFEAGLNYKDVPDPAVKVSFPLDDDEDNAEMVIWTTTPW